MLSINSSKRYLLIGAVVAILVVAGAGAAFALSDNGNTYTGCLDPGGTIIHVAIGDQPAKMCAPSHTQISWNETGPPGQDGVDGANGQDGVDGANGQDGVDGQDCANCIAGYEVILSKVFFTDVQPRDIMTVDASCPPSKQALGGGGIALPSGDVVLQASYPKNGTGASGWVVQFLLDSTVAVDDVAVEAFAICAGSSG